MQLSPEDVAPGPQPLAPFVAFVAFRGTGVRFEGPGFSDYVRGA